MGQVTNGTVRFERTVKISEYEPKKAAAELTFTVGEGEDFEKMFSTASLAAQAKVLSMLGLSQPPAGATAEPAKSQAATTRKPPAAPKPDGAKVTEATPIDPKVAHAAKANGGGAAVVEEDLTGEAPLTDADMRDAAKKAADKLNDAPTVRKLIWKYAGEGKHSHEIPAGARRAFVAELEKLTAPQAL